MAILDHDRSRRGPIHEIVIRLHIRTGTAPRVVELNGTKVICDQGRHIPFQCQWPIRRQLAVLATVFRPTADAVRLWTVVAVPGSR